MARYVLIHSSSNLSLIDQSRFRVSLVQTSVTGPAFGQRVNARGVAFATCRILQPFAARQGKGQGYGKVYC